MFPFLFKKKPKFPPDALVSENWKTSFGSFDDKRFIEESSPTYVSQADKGKLVLTINKKNHFAWVLSKLYNYNDFCIEAETGFEENDPYSALGFVLRYINDQNFYYFLINNKGYFRFDVVFNNNPLSRIGWTYSPLINPDENSIRIIAHGSHFSFYIDDDWIAEIDDETIPQGRIGFAGQNYGDKETASLSLKHFSIESRGIEVEKQFERWVNTVPQEPEYRINLAKSFFSMAEYTAAAIQLKKALRQKRPTADDFFLFTEIAINLRMYELALKNIERCLTLDPGRKDAMQEKANILYIDNEFIKARDYIESVIDKFGDSATMWNLYGNCEYAIGNWKDAAKAYVKATSIQPEMPLFRLNAAHALEIAEKKKEALTEYITVSKIFFREEAFDELYSIFSRVQKLDPENKDVVALRGEILFFEKNYDEAEKIFLDLENNGTKESTVFYLEGLIQSFRGDKRKALGYFTKAIEIEDTFPRYWLKAAEYKLLLDENPEAELAKAMSLAPDDPWVLNQNGLYALKLKKNEDARDYFIKAQEKAPNEIDILLNLSDAYSRCGETDKAFSILDREDLEKNPRVINHRGNLFSAKGDYEHARSEYEKAMNADPENVVYMENCAKACLELDMIMRAEELLTQLFDISPTASVHNLIGYLALIKREWVRAEIAFRQGLAIDPENIPIKLNLASLALDRSDYAKAKQFVTEVLAKEPANKEGLRIEKRLKESFEVRMECASCRREWWAPKNISPQQSVKIVGAPPQDAPAGKCGKCGKIYCIACAQSHMKENRFVCPDCAEFLKLSDDWIKYVVLEKIGPAQ